LSFTIESSNDPGKEIRKAAARQLKKSEDILLRAVYQRSIGDKAIHTFRKSTKRVRALLRLVGKELGKENFQHDNKALRDVARPLSRLRDATALIEALNLLHDDYCKEGEWDGAFDQLRTALRSRRRRIRRHMLERHDELGVALRRLRKLQSRVNEWDFRQALKGLLRSSLRKTYVRSRRAMRAAHKDGSDERLHEYRKRAKDLQYQLELLQPMFPRPLRMIRGRVHRLTTLLGTDHDLAVLRGFAEGTIRGLIDRRRRELQVSVQSLGGKLYSDTPAQFSERLHSAKRNRVIS
jgi:CHAD domain-containing protein